MESLEFRTKLQELKTSFRRFASYIGANDRTVRRWANGEQGIPPWVPVLLNLLIEATETRGGQAYNEMRAAQSAFLELFTKWATNTSPPASLVLAEAEQAADLIRSLAASMKRGGPEIE